MRWTALLLVMLSGCASTQPRLTVGLSHKIESNESTVTVTYEMK